MDIIVQGLKKNSDGTKSAVEIELQVDTDGYVTCYLVSEGIAKTVPDACGGSTRLSA